MKGLSGRSGRFGAEKLLVGAIAMCLAALPSCDNAGEEPVGNRTAENDRGAGSAIRVHTAVGADTTGPAAASLDAAADTVSRPRTPGAYTVDTILEDAAVGGDGGAAIAERMDREAGGIASDLDGTAVERVGEGIKVTLELGILFDEGSDRIGPAAMDHLSRLAERLNAFEEADVVVIGHTDSRGTPEQNLELSERRARAAADYLVSEGVAPSRVSHIGRGENEPLVFEDGVVDQRKNRRVEFAIVASGRAGGASDGDGAGNGAGQR